MSVAIFHHIVDMENNLAERILVRIPGHTRWILGSYLHAEKDGIQTFIAADAVEEFFVRCLVWLLK